MRRLATLLFATLLVVPAALAQVTASDPLRLAPSTESRRVAPGDTTVIRSFPDSTTLISTWRFGETDYLFGTNNAGVFGFGSAYDLGDVGASADAELEVIGGTFYATTTPDAGDGTFEVSVYNGTLESGPTGEPLYSESFSSDLIPEVTSAGVSPTAFYFEVPVIVEGPIFFITFDVEGISSQLAVGSTGDLDVPTPETVFRVILEDGGEPEWTRVDENVSISEGNPLQVFLLSEALILEGGEEFVVQPIAEARAAGSGATVTFEGTVTRSEGAFTYLQDETGGLTIRQTSGAFFDAVAANTVRPGATLRVTGTLSEFNGLLQVNGTDLESFEPIAYPPVPEPQEVTLAELAQNGEAYEGELVLVTDVTFEDPPVQFEAATTYQVSDPTDDSNAVTVRVPNADDTLIDGTDFLGDPSRVTGVVGQFSSTDPDAGYQILLVNIREVLPNAVAVGEDPDGRLALGALVPNPSASTAEATVSLAEAGPATLVVFDVLGREVARVLDRDLAAGDHAIRVDVSGLPAGAYVARLSAAGTTVARPFTVVR